MKQSEETKFIPQEIKTELMNIDELIPYENNPRINDDAVKYVAESIKAFGQNQPIVIDKNNVIIVGHTRLKACQSLGMEQVLVWKRSELTDEQVREYRLADNKVAEFSKWDFDKLDQERKIIDEMMGNLEMFGFEAMQQDFIVEEDDADFDVEKEVEQIKIARTKKGDLYLLGNHRLMCGDSTDEQDIKKLMDGKLADLIITDPPYNVDYEGQDGMKIINDKMGDKKFYNFLLEAYKRMFEFAKLGCPIYVFHADTEGVNFRSALKEAGFKLAQCLVWVKSSLVLGRQDYHWRHEPILYGWKEGMAHKWYGDRDKDTVVTLEDKFNPSTLTKKDLISLVKELLKPKENSTVIQEDKPSASDLHPTMKPIKLLEKLIKNSSVPTDLVFDPFGGSGSTMITCEQMKRTAYLMELDPIYVDVIVKRWEKLTGKEAELIRE